MREMPGMELLVFIRQLNHRTNQLKETLTARISKKETGKANKIIQGYFWKLNVFQILKKESDIPERMSPIYNSDQAKACLEIQNRLSKTLSAYFICSSLEQAGVQIQGSITCSDIPMRRKQPPYWFRAIHKYPARNGRL